MLNEFSNKINELKSNYLVGLDEEIEDVMENISIFYSSQLIFYFFKNIEKDKPGLSSIQFPSQKAIPEKVNLRRQKAYDEDLSDMSSLEGKGLKVLTPNKLSTRLPIILAQIKAENKSYKLKSEIRLILYLLQQHNQITKNVYNNLMKSL